MGKYINFGKYNKNYIYVILECIFLILKYYLPTILINILYYNEKINEYTVYLFKHDRMIENFRYFGLLIFSFILYKYEKKSSESKQNVGETNDLNSERGCFEVIKMNDERKKNLNNKKFFLYLNIIIVISICLIIEFLSEIIAPLSVFSPWMIILLIISFIKAKMFKHEIYKHQKLGIFITFISDFIYQLISFILSLNSEEANKRNIYKDYLSLWFLPLGLIIYIIYVSITSYIYSKMKWFMDLKWISMTKLLMIYALLGLIINIIYCIILTYIKCEGNASNYFCNIEDINDVQYIENISEFFDDISNVYKENKSYIIYFVCIVFADVIFFSLFIFYFFLILKYLTPEFYFFTGSIGEIFIKIIEIFMNKIFGNYYFVEEGKGIKIPLILFLLCIFGNSVAFIGFLIYLEIIELNFYDLNYNLRRKIIERSIEDSIQRDSINDDQNENLIDCENPKKISELSTKTLN